VIVSLCSVKGAPGVTALAVALAAVWPGDRVLLEADTAGADLPFRLHAVDGGVLAPEPSGAGVTAAARLQPVGADGLGRFGQPTSLGFPVIPGLLTAARYAGMRGLWPQLASVCAAWPGLVLADLGRLTPGSAALPLATASSSVLLLACYSTEGLFHLRERLGELASALGDPARPGTSVAVVVSGPARYEGAARRETPELLASIGSAAPLAGFFATDSVARLWEGTVTRRLLRTPTLRSAGRLAATMQAMLPGAPAAERAGDVAGVGR
jgi:hypothetical protein